MRTSRPAALYHRRVIPGPDPARVLVADPERESRDSASAALEARQLEVWTVAAMAEAWKLVEERGLPHAAVVELGDPAFDGAGFCERVRQIADLPIVAMSFLHDTSLIVRTLDRHADDFVRKPFEPAELAARVVSLLRRIPGFSYTTGALVRVDDRVAIDFGRRTLIVGDERRALTPTETKILYLLVREVGRTVESRFLLARLWPMEEAGEETLRAHVYRLRSKLEPADERYQYIWTVRGVGYRFALPGGVIGVERVGAAPDTEPAVLRESPRPPR
jgi:DNA-binding response OmpR family regulator